MTTYSSLKRVAECRRRRGSIKHHHIISTTSPFPIEHIYLWCFRNVRPEPPPRFPAFLKSACRISGGRPWAFTFLAGIDKGCQLHLFPRGPWAGSHRELAACDRTVSGLKRAGAIGIGSTPV